MAAVKVLIAVLLLISFDAKALVNPVNRSWSISHTDYTSPELSLFRDYHSERKGSGLFGKGWCSVFESKLIQDKNEFYFNYCGQGRTYSLPVTTSRNTFSRLEKQNSQYRAVVGSGTYVFDSNFRLIFIETTALKIKLFYDGQKLSNIQTKTQDWRLFYGKEGQVSKIDFSKEYSVTYQYQNEGVNLLKSVVLPGKKTFNYGWTAKNMISVFETGKGAKTLAYEDNKVKSVKAAGCTEELIQDGPKLTVKKQCPGQKLFAKTFVINGDKNFNDYSVAETTDQQKIKKTFRGGQVASVTKNGETLEFSYDKRGRVLSFSSNKLIFDNRIGDDAHTRSFDIKLKNKPAESLGKLKLDWHGTKLVGYQLLGEKVNFKPVDGGMRVTRGDFDLVGTSRAPASFIEGKIGKSVVKKFKVDPMGRGLSFDQKEAQAQYANEINMYNVLGGL